MAEATPESSKLGTSAAQGPDDLNHLVLDGKNSNHIRCERCRSLILKPAMATLKITKMFLPHMKKKSENQNPEDGETLERMWLVKDAFDFENVGFTNTVGTLKYLICADCEIGPIGWHDLTDKKAYYVALERIVHD